MNEVLVDRQAYGDVQEALKSLTSKQYQAWWDHKMRGLSYAQIAAMRGVSKTCVRSRVDRGHEKLLLELAKKGRLNGD